MTRIPFYSVIMVRGVIEGTWSIGSTEARPGIDRPVITDPRTNGNPILPATTLVGSLRAHLGSSAAEWFGDEVGADAAKATPSRIWAGPVEHSALAADLGQRQRTRIDPVRRAAYGRSLRTDQVVDSGRRTNWWWLLLHPGRADQELLNAIASWTARIGGGQSMGQGLLTTERVRAFDVDLGSPAGLDWWLQGRAEWLARPAATRDVPPAAAQSYTGKRADRAAGETILIDQVFAITDPIHVGTGAPTDDAAARGRAARPSPVERRGPGSSGPPIVPGSSWKGVFRHRVEFILRAVDVPDADRDVIVDVLFGRSPTRSSPSPARRGLLVFQTSTVQEPTVRPRSHVAIDRITGGAADKLLFAWDGVHGRLRVQVGAAEPIEPAVATLLAHVVRDLDDGIVGIGGGATRGYGTVASVEPVQPPGPINVQGLVAWAGTQGQAVEVAE